MRYIIGDIHANTQELKRLLKHLNLTEDDELIFLGDYIGKLPHTREILELLTALQRKHKCIFLKGNHEFVWDRYVNGKEIERQSFLLEYGGKEALSEFDLEVQQALENNELEVLNEALKPYFDLITDTKDWVIIDEFLVLHAGLLEEQYDQTPIRFREKNYFLRPEHIPTEKKYLDQYVLVAGHTYLGDEPTMCEGYINIDLGAGFGKHICAFSIDEQIIVRSDGTVFPVKNPIHEEK